ncbi:MAG: AraC family transcriptional regulator [Mucilaginibacter sp.]|nr:AraC family transcriptional regulator [Mucilaginibacter sp.]
MKKSKPAIPVHKLSDHATSGISVRPVNGSALRDSHVMRAHRDDHYIFVLQHEGQSGLMVDFEEIAANGTAVLAILPRQVHYSILSNNVTGWLLAIDTLLVDESYRRVFEGDILKLKPVTINAEQAQHLERCIQVLYLLLKDQENTPSRNIICTHLASAFIGLIAEIYLDAETNQEHSDSRVAIINRQFRTLLRQSYIKEKRPAQYAIMLNLSLAYLNECVKTITGMPVSFWIQQEIILEAKRLLYHSTLSVKEIAFALGFDDHTYFSRVFVKAAGMSPMAFRKTNHE